MADATPFCSTVIATIGRPSLDRAVRSVLDQELPGATFEVIVVNDSGRDLPPSDWQHAPQVRLLDTHRHERSVARNAGAAIARGRYLHFLDDDDRLLPGALSTLHDLAQKSSARWCYGSTRLVDRDGNSLITLRQDLQGNCFVQAVAGEWIPLQASLVEADLFFAVGAFNPHIPGAEDADLIRRLALHVDVAGTATPVACVTMGADGSTTNSGRALQGSRWARERVLDTPAGWQRMRASADNAYRHGRIVRAYLTSALWNLRRRRTFTALSRTGRGLLAFFPAGRHLFSAAFWHAVTRPYASATFARGFRERGRDRQENARPYQSR